MSGGREGRELGVICAAGQHDIPNLIAYSCGVCPSLVMHGGSGSGE